MKLVELSVFFLELSLYEDRISWSELKALLSRLIDCIPEKFLFKVLGILATTYLYNSLLMIEIFSSSIWSSSLLDNNGY